MSRERELYVPPTEDARPEHFETIDPLRRPETTAESYIRIVTPLIEAVSYPFKKVGDHIRTRKKEHRRDTYTPEQDELRQQVLNELPGTDAVQDVRRATDEDLAGYTDDFDPTDYTFTILPQHRDIVVELDHDLDLNTMESVLEEHDYAWRSRDDERLAWHHDDPEDTHTPHYVCMKDSRYKLGGHYRDPQPPLPDPKPERTFPEYIEQHRNHDGPNKRLELLTSYLEELE